MGYGQFISGLAHIKDSVERVMFVGQAEQGVMDMVAEISKTVTIRWTELMIVAPL
jgi:hypothetical protein